MKKIFSVLIMMLLFTGSAFASHVDYLSDRSAEWIGNPNRFGTTNSVDGVYYNPAGMAKMKDGFYTNISNQVILNDYKIEIGKSTTDFSFSSTLNDGFTNYPGMNTYEQHKHSPVVPNIYMLYKKDNWGVMASAGVLGGGGSLYWEDGTPLINGIVQSLDTLGAFTSTYDPTGGQSKYFGYGGTGATPVGASVSVNMTSFLLESTVGVLYEINNTISVSAGVRYIYSKKATKIEIRSAGFGGEKDTLYDGSWDASSVQAILGVNIAPTEKLNIGITFESIGIMNYKVTVDEDASYGGMLARSAGYIDGREFRYDLPPRLNMGVEYDVTDRFKVMSSSCIYFANWGTYEGPKDNGPTYTGANEDLPTHLGYEIGAGLEWQFLENVTWTGGFTWNYIGADNSTDNEMIYKNDCWNLGTGIIVKTSSGVKLVFSFMRNIYPDTSNSEGVFISGSQMAGATSNGYTDQVNYNTTYKKVSHVVAFGAEYNFL